MRIKERKGFTLIELLVVIIIVGILASVAIPMMSANVARARRSEANAGLGTVMTQLRAHFSEFNAYNAAPLNVAVPMPVTTLTTIGLTDLDGRFFDTNDYQITAIAAGTFTVTCTGGADPDTAPRAADVNGVVITINQVGTITPAP